MDEYREPLRLSVNRRRVDEWQLALISAGIDSRIDWTTGGYVLLVRAGDRAAADDVVAAFDAENPPRPPRLSDRRELPASRAAIIVAVLLCAFFVVTGSRDAGPYWFEHGEADAARIAAGERWRVVTALTLHADFGHILSNAATLMIFGSALCGLVGAGIGIWVMLLAGGLGNWLTALLRGPPHSAVGASTAIFGGLGALAAIQLLRRRHGAVSTWRAVAPMAAGLGLLAFLGTAPQSDVLAHLFGFAIGAGLGPFAVGLGGLGESQRVQAALVAAAAAVVLGCWMVATSR